MEVLKRLMKLVAHHPVVASFILQKTKGAKKHGGSIGRRIAKFIKRAAEEGCIGGHRPEPTLESRQDHSHFADRHC